MNGILLVDKQSGESSHDVVRRIRKILKIKRVGHAGTLDPLATGLLVIGVGEGTKLLHYLQADDKRYVSEIRLGEETDSLDADGEVVARAPLPQRLDHEQVRAAAESLLGTGPQRVPLISAIKVQGRALHQRTRAGEEIQAPLREVTLHDVQVLDVQPPCIKLEVHCAKGFYVRAFARDIAEKLGTKGHVCSLRRIESGAFQIDEAHRLVDAPKDADAAQVWLASRLLDLSAACRGMSSVKVNAKGEEDSRHGRPISFDDLEEKKADLDSALPIAIFNGAGTLLAMARVEAGALHVRRGFLLDGA